MPDHPPGNLNDEFAAAVRRAGIAIPDERWDAMLQAYEGMQALLKVLDDPLAYEDEPMTMPRFDAGAGR